MFGIFLNTCSPGREGKKATWQFSIGMVTEKGKLRGHFWSCTNPGPKVTTIIPSRIVRKPGKAVSTNWVINFWSFHLFELPDLKNMYDSWVWAELRVGIVWDFPSTAGATSMPMSLQVTLVAPWMGTRVPLGLQWLCWVRFWLHSTSICILHLQNGNKLLCLKPCPQRKHCKLHRL